MATTTVAGIITDPVVVGGSTTTAGVGSTIAGTREGASTGAAINNAAGAETVGAEETAATTEPDHTRLLSPLLSLFSLTV